MLVTVQSASKPAYPRRALYLTLGLLALSAALALSLIRQRRDHPLGPELSLHPLPVLMQPPKGFRLVPTRASDAGQAVFLIGRTRSGEAALAVWRMVDVSTKDFVRVAEDVIHWQSKLWKSSTSPIVLTTLRGKIGDKEGVELVNFKEGSVARIAELAPDEVYVISLSVRNGPVDARLHEIFDLGCGSVRLESSGRR